MVVCLRGGSRLKWNLSREYIALSIRVEKMMSRVWTGLGGAVKSNLISRGLDSLHIWKGEGEEKSLNCLRNLMSVTHVVRACEWKCSGVKGKKELSEVKFRTFAVTNI